MQQVTLDSFLGSVILIFTAVGLVSGAIWKLIKASDKRTAAISAAQTATLTATLEKKFEEKLRPIKAELETPSGKTLKDTVTQVSEQVSDLQQTGDERHRENQDRLEAQQETLEDQQHEMDIISRAFAVVLRAWRRSDPELPGLSDELLVDLDRTSDRRGRYRHGYRSDRPRRKDNE
jgi:gas vesicle protein